MLENSPNVKSDCNSLKLVLVNENLIIAPLTSAMMDTQPMETLDVTPFEEHFVNKAMENPGMRNDAVVNLMQHKKTKHREKLRLALRSGVPTANSCLCTHHFRNNKRSTWLHFYLENESSQQITEYVQKCIDMTPKIVSRSRMNVVKSGMTKMLLMKFAQKSSKINCMISTVAESLNCTVKLNQNHKEEIKSELNLLSELENQNLLEDSLLGKKTLCGGETKFKVLQKK